MSTSGTYDFNPPLGDLAIECFERIGVRASEITPDHIISFRRSVNLVFSSWSNRGVNLWKVDLQSVPLVQGLTTYSVPSNTVMVLDVYIRTYSMGATTNFVPDFATTNNSNLVTLNLQSSGVQFGQYINIIIPIAVGGLILYGFYQVNSVLSNNLFTILAASKATSTVASGGVVPLFLTAAGLETVVVTLPKHGYLTGQPFVVQVQTNVGGIALMGNYTITSVVDADNFTISAINPAGFDASMYENNGNTQITIQQQVQNPVDRIMAPISRTDYAALPDKTVQGFPTTFWYDRTLNPTLTIWQPPDGNGPYQMFYYRVTQIQDGIPQDGQTADIPYRFLEALSAETAFHLSMKWNPQMAVALKAYADEKWGEAGAEDRERVSLYLQPDLSGYYRD